MPSLDSRSRKGFDETRLSLAQQASEFGDEFANCDVKIRVDRVSVDIPPRQCQPGASGKASGRSAVAPQDDFGGERVICEARNGPNLFASEPAQGRAQTEMMSCDVDRKVSHVFWFESSDYLERVV